VLKIKQAAGVLPLKITANALNTVVNVGHFL